MEWMFFTFMFIFVLIGAGLFFLSQVTATAFAPYVGRARRILAALPFLAFLTTLLHPLIGVFTASLAIGFSKRVPMFKSAALVGWAAIAFAVIYQSLISLMALPRGQ